MAGTPSIADEYAGFDTFQEAMLEHADRRKREGKPPQAWNPWLKEAAEIAREAGIPNALSGAGVGNRQFSDIRKLVNSAAFGPDWQQQVSRDNPDVRRLEEAARAQKAEEAVASRAQPVSTAAAAPPGTRSTRPISRRATRRRCTAWSARRTFSSAASSTSTR